MNKRKEPSAIAAILGVILITLFIVLAFAVTPLLALVVGMAVGYIVEFVTGDYVIQALHSIGLTGVKSGDLPKVFGLLALIAVFIKGGMPTQKGGTKRKGDD